MTLPSVTVCRINGAFAHFPHEAVTPESFHGLSEHLRNWRNEPYVRHIRSPTPIPIQFNQMMVRNHELPSVQNCLARMRSRQDLTSSKITVTLEQPLLSLPEQRLTKLTSDDLPARLHISLWVLTPEPQLNLMEDGLRDEPWTALPEMVRKSLFLQAWLAEEPDRKLRHKPDWMEARGIMLPDHDTLMVHGLELLQACEDMVRKHPRTPSH